MNYLLLLFFLFCIGYGSLMMIDVPSSQKRVQRTPVQPKPILVQAAGVAEIKPLQPKPVFDVKKAEGLNDILVAIGFPKREAKSTVKRILNETPDISKEDFLRKVMEK